MKTVKAFFAKELVSQSLAPGYTFKDANNGKKTYVDFEWDGDDFIIDATGMHLQTGAWSDDYSPNLHVSSDFAVEMGWFLDKGNDVYELGPNLMMEPVNDTMPQPKDINWPPRDYWKVIDTAKGGKFVRLTMLCNWRFINLNVAFKNVTGTTKRSLFVYSDVGGSGVVGNQVTDLLREVNYNREGKGSQYFEPLHIQYIQVHKEVLDIIEVQVSETTGELVKFGAGNTIVTLHFKKT